MLLFLYNLPSPPAGSAVVSVDYGGGIVAAQQCYHAGAAASQTYHAGGEAAQGYHAGAEASQTA